MAQTISALEYLRSRSEVDLDSQDHEVAKKLGPFAGCTSNQIDSYYEFVNPQRDALIRKSALLAREFQADYPQVSLEELAVEVGMASISLSITPLVTGSIFVMANPLLANSTTKVVENSMRLESLCRRLKPDFDISRLCIKVPATWEGLQACRKLKTIGINTLATTVFTVEQTALAAEVGCSFVSPFGNELMAILDDSHPNDGPFLDVPIQAQRYFLANSFHTRVKAAGLKTARETMHLAGISSITIPAAVLQALADWKEEPTVFDGLSLIGRNEDTATVLPRQEYVDAEERYRADFAKRDGGKGQKRVAEAIEVFCSFQRKAETVMAGLLA